MTGPILGAMSDNDKRQFRYAPQPLGRMLQGMFRGAPGVARARAFAGLKQDWLAIAGPEFGEISWPERFEPSRNGRAGVLAIRAASGAALLLQHDGPRLIERVNGYLGADAVGRIRIVPGAPPPPRPGRIPPPPADLAPDSPRAKRILERADSLESDRLGAALKRLAARVGERK